MKIQQKLLLSFLLPSLTAGITVCLAIANNLSILNNIALVNQSYIKEVTALTQIKFAGTAIQSYANYLRRYNNSALEQTPAPLTKAEIYTGIKIELNNLATNLNNLKAATNRSIYISERSLFKQSDEIQQAKNELVTINNFGTKLTNYGQLVNEYLKFNNTDSIKAESFLNQSLEPYFRTIIVPLIKEASNDAQAELTREVKEIEQSIAHNNTVISILAGLSFALSIILSSLLSRTISQPIVELKKAAVSIAKGNWSTRLSVKNKDELGSLAKAFNQMNEALEKTTVSKAYVDNIIETIVDSLIVLDRDNKIVKVNKATLSYLGYKEEELIYQPFSKVLVQTEIAKAFAKKELIKRMETSYLKKNGEQISVLLSSSLMRNQAGEIQGIVCVAGDISEQKAQEGDRAIAEAEKNLLSTAISYAAEAIEITDTEARFIYVNPAFETITGYKPSEVIGKTSASVLRSGKHDQAMYQEIANTLSNGEVWSGSYIGRRKDGTSYHQDVTIAPVFNLAGLITHHVAVKRDITERKKAEERLEKINQCFLSFKTDPRVNINRLTALCGELLAANCALYSRLDRETLYAVGQWQTPKGYKGVNNAEGRMCYDVINSSNDEVFIVNDLLNTKYAQTEPNVQQYNLHTYVGQVVKCEGLKVGAVCALYKQNFIPSNADRKILGIIAAAIGVEEERRVTQQALSASEERYALAAQGANDGLWDWNLLTEEIYFSPRWQTMLGLSTGEIGNKKEDWFSRVHPEDIEQLKNAIASHLEGKVPYLENEYRIQHKNGLTRWMLVRGLAVSSPTGKPQRLAGSQTDITEKKAAEAQLRYDSCHDSLTGLANRRLFMERLEEVIARTDDKNYLFAVLFLDIDRFKVVNDTLSHKVGDRLLVAVARALESCVRPEDTVARLGGDEFTVLLDNIKGIDNATQAAERIQNQLSLPFNIGGNEVFGTVSIGIALSSNGYKQAEDILRDADMTMYNVKTHRNGGQHYQIFDPNLHSKAMGMLQLENDLRGALGRQEFVLCYQPIVSLKNFRLVGFEALIRWQHPERGLVSPVQFIPMAEATGLINAIGYWTLEEACRQLKFWQEQFPGKPSLTISVNLSTKQFTQADLLDQIEKALQITGLESRFLKLEITESVLVENAERVNAMLVKMQQMGVRLSLDDFGTGYSSLSYMHSFPIDTLKIDRSFVTGVDTELGKIEIIRTVVGLAWNLGMDTIAEGVETKTQMYQLKSLKCNSAQGYYFSRPLDVKAAVALIADEREYFSNINQVEGLEFWARK